MFVIFGATGKVGGAAAIELRRRGLAVRAVTRKAARANRLAAAGCEVVEGDLSDEASLGSTMKGASAALLICPLRAGAEDVATDAKRTLDISARAIATARPDRVVVISDYGAQHASGTGITTIFHYLEACLAKTGVPTTFLRSAEHMQNWLRYAAFVRDSGVLPSMHHPTMKLFPTVSAHDVGVEAANLLAGSSTTAPHVVHVEGPTRYSAVDVADAYASILGRAVTAEALPHYGWAPALRRAGLGESYAQLVVDLQDAHNAGRIDDEKGVGELRRGATTLRDALAAALAR